MNIEILKHGLPLTPCFHCREAQVRSLVREVLHVTRVAKKMKCEEK